MSKLAYFNPYSILVPFLISEKHDDDKSQYFINPLHKRSYKLLYKSFISITFIELVFTLVEGYKLEDII